MEHGNGYYSESGAGALRIERYRAKKDATETMRAKAFRLIEYAHNARVQGNLAKARQWLTLHKVWRLQCVEKGLRDGFI